jgi:hypothetical protein
VPQDTSSNGAVNLQHELDDALSLDSDAYYKDYQKVLCFIAVWVVAVILAVVMIDAPDRDPIWKHRDYHSTFGYTYSLVLLFLPLTFLIFWFFRHRDVKHLRQLMREMLRIVLFSALGWSLLDVFFANALFTFPDERAHVRQTVIPGYLWKGECRSIWTLWNFPACYFPRSIPLEEVLFYLGGAALLTMMYMWASEDFYSAYTLPRRQYEERAKKTGPLVLWNKYLILIGVAVAVAGTIVKKWGWWHPYHEGLPYYLFAELVIVFVPLSALYTRVHKFTNPRAFIFVISVQILVSVIWEATLALPFGWWAYQQSTMVGIFVSAWSHLAIEACGLWLSVGWASMFVYETTKIKVVTGRTWRQVLFGWSSYSGSRMADLPDSSGATAR